MFNEINKTFSDCLEKWSGVVSEVLRWTGPPCNPKQVQCCASYYVKAIKLLISAMITLFQKELRNYGSNYLKTNNLLVWKSSYSIVSHKIQPYYKLLDILTV